MTIEKLQEIFNRKGYTWDPLINVVGERNKSTNKITNKFDDKLYLAYFQDNTWKLKEYQITTDAGRYYMRVKLINPKGAGILKEGQYNVYSLRLHQGKYEAFCQTWGNVTVYRDRNLNDEYDFSNEESGSFGVNVHMAGDDSTIIENWSASCQVFKRKKDFYEFLSIVRLYRVQKKNRYSYTLINTND